MIWYSPGMILVPPKDAHDEAYVQDSWPMMKLDDYEIDVANWKYDGNFAGVKSRVKLVFDKESRTEPRHRDESKLITELPCYPIEYADQQVKKRLYKAGREFWSCRYKRFVSHNGWDANREEWNVRPNLISDISS